MGEQDPADSLTAAKLFNDAVASTAVVGSLIEKTTDTNERVTRMEPKLDRVVSSMDHYGGVMIVVGGLLSVAASLVVGFLLTLLH